MTIGIGKAHFNVDEQYGNIISKRRNNMCVFCPKGVGISA
jgi:hypothetical protein